MKITLYVVHQQFHWQDEGTLEFSTFKYEDSDHRKNLTSIEVEVPDMQPLTPEQTVPHWVAQLKQQKKSIQAEAHKKLAELADKIANMLAINYSTPTIDTEDNIPF